jgi:processive 1,2-diacylglycerol beta-glucosyltransferase
MKILLLYAKVGNGHLKAAENVKTALQELNEDIEIDYEDGLEYSSALTNKLIIKGYASLARSMPKLWGTIYNNSDKQDINAVGEINKMVNKALTIRLKKMLRTRRPDIIISTHPFVSHMCAYLKRKGKTSAKIISVMTDYGIHNMWLEENKYIDKFMVATDEMKGDCVREYGVSESKIFVTGIPVSKKFSKSYDKYQILKDLGLSQGKTTLLFFAGGGLGLGKSEVIFEELINSDYDFQIIAVTGKNEKQKERFEAIAGKSNKNITVLGFTDKVPELMSASDFVITKPGGLTSTECLAMCKPMIIINPIPGQEEQNSIYFTNNGTALRTYKNEPIEHVLDIAMYNEKRVNQMIEMCKVIGKPNSSKTVVDEVIRIYNEGK